MAEMLKNMGLEMLLEDEDGAMGLMGMIAQEGKVLEGYYDAISIIKTFKGVDLITRAISNDSGQYELSGFDTHCSGNCIWDVVIKSDITPKDADCNQRRLLVSRSEDGEGLAVVNLVNADVLPSFLEGDTVKMQMVGFPLFTEFFENDDEYADSIPEPDFGKKVILSDGIVFPSGFMRNHMPDIDEEIDEELDDINLIYGEITGFNHGYFEFRDNTYDQFVLIGVETHFGKIHLAVSHEMIEDVPNEKLVKGTKIVAGAVLSGDVAIYDYDQGLIRDEEHDLRAIRHAIVSGETDRMKKLLSYNCTYTSEVGKWEKEGKDEVLGIFEHVKDAATCKYKAHMATLITPEDEMFVPEYEAGKRCVVLDSSDVGLESILFIDYDDDNQIQRIKISGESRYKFVIDQPISYDYENLDIEVPAVLSERMRNRAKAFDLIDEDMDVTIDMINEESSKVAEQLISDIITNLDPKERCGGLDYKSAFGQAFACGAGHDDEEKYIKMGSQFFLDYKNLLDKDVPDDITEIDEFVEGMIEPLALTYIIGTLYRKKHEFKYDIPEGYEYLKLDGDNEIQYKVKDEVKNMKATFEITGWAGTETHIFEGGDANEIAAKLQNKQDMECLYRMGSEFGEDKKVLKKLGKFIDKYNRGTLEKKDLEEFDIKLSVGRFRCVEVSE